MSRLTERDEFGNADIIGVDSQDLTENIGPGELLLLTSALNKLAAYEEAAEAKEPCASCNPATSRIKIIRGEKTGVGDCYISPAMDGYGWFFESAKGTAFLPIFFCPFCGRKLE